MVKFQYLIWDMHLGIVKFYGILSKSFLKNTDRMFFLNLSERQVHLFCDNTVYRRKGSYRFKTAFPGPYPLQKRSLFAKNILSRDSDIKR